MPRFQRHYKVGRHALLCFQSELHRNSYATYLKLLPVGCFGGIVLCISQYGANHACRHLCQLGVYMYCEAWAVLSPPPVDIHKTHTRRSSRLYAPKFEHEWWSKEFPYSCSSGTTAGVFLKNPEWPWRLVIRVRKLSESASVKSPLASKALAHLTEVVRAAYVHQYSGELFKSLFEPY